MRPILILSAAFLFAFTATAQQPPPSGPAPAKPAGIRLGTITWAAAEERLKPADTVVVLPIAAGAAQHGPHLKLGNDHILAEYLIGRLVDGSDVVVAPTLSYDYSPAFLEYPGSPSLSLTTARDLTADVARSLARHGPRRYYALNTGLSTTQALIESAKLLATEGILLRFTDARTLLDTAVRKVQRQVVGRHADEIETSMMLFVEPASVDLDRAVREYGPPSTPFRLTRRAGGPGTYSPTGIWGDATLATREKGRELTEALVTAMRADIEEARRAPLPSRTAAASGSDARPATRPGGLPDRFGRGPDECLAGDERAIRAIGPAFYVAWANLNAEGLANFWATEGDMVHPDGFVERTSQVIRQNRTSLFMRPEYRGSRHELTIGQIRCITGEVAIADAKWELRGVTDDKRQPVPAVEGLCTLVLEKGEGGWKIEAYRYSMNPQSATRPTLLQRPGLPDAVR